MFNYENYYKDIQFMASRECYYIDHYQAFIRHRNGLFGKNPLTLTLVYGL